MIDPNKYLTPEEREMPLPDEGMPKYHRGRVFAAGFTIFLLILIVLIMFSCGPRQGTMLYGICKTYLEQSTPYPETLVPTNVEQYATATRIYFTSIDPFGQYKLEYIECTYKADAQNNLVVDKILINRREEDAEKVKLFNNSLSAIVESEPDLSLPEPYPDINEILDALDD